MKNTIDKIFAELSTDATLTAYVKSFSQGGMSRARLMFPFVNVGAIEDSISALTIGSVGKSDISDFRCLVEFGVKSTIPELAYTGDATTKGILHMCDDLRLLCSRNKFDGAFLIPATVERVRIDVIQDSADWIWIGELTILGRRTETRQVRC